MTAFTEITALLIESQHEASDIDPSRYIVCFASDYTPFRISGDRIAINGKHLHSFPSSAEADDVARALHFKAFPLGHTVVSMKASYWKVKRIEKLDALINRMREVESHVRTVDPTAQIFS